MIGARMTVVRPDSGGAPTTEYGQTSWDSRGNRNPGALNWSVQFARESILGTEARVAAWVVAGMRRPLLGLIFLRRSIGSWGPLAALPVWAKLSDRRSSGRGAGKPYLAAERFYLISCAYSHLFRKVWAEDQKGRKSENRRKLPRGRMADITVNSLLLVPKQRESTHAIGSGPAS